MCGTPDEAMQRWLLTLELSAHPKGITYVKIPAHTEASSFTLLFFGNHSFSCPQFWKGNERENIVLKLEWRKENPASVLCYRTPMRLLLFEIILEMTVPEYQSKKYHVNRDLLLISVHWQKVEFLLSAANYPLHNQNNFFLIWSQLF